MTEEAQPTAEDLTKATQVSQAAAEAAAKARAQGGSEGDVRQAATSAMDSRAREVNLTLPDEDRNAIADLFIEKLRDAGAFDPTPPAEPTPTPTPTPEAAAAAAAAEATNPEPRKRTLAEKFAGI